MNRLGLFSLSSGRSLQIASRFLSNTTARNRRGLDSSPWFLRHSSRGITPDGSRTFQSDTQRKKPLQATKEEETATLKEFSEIPGPKALPFVGNLLTILMHKDYDVTRFHVTWESLIREYGPILKLTFPGMPVIVATTNPDDIQMFFTSTMDRPTRQVILSLKSVRDNSPNDYFKKKTGLLGENGEEWYRLRSKVQGTLLKPRNVEAYLPLVDKTTKAYMERIDVLQEKTGQIPDNFLEDIYLWALECLGHVALDKDLGCLEPGLGPDSVPKRLIRHLTDLFDAMTELEVGPKTWKLYRTKSYVKMEAAHNAFLEIVDKSTDEALRRFAESEDDPKRTLSIMETLLKTPDLTKNDVVTVILDMFFAGMDTISHALAFALYHLATNPDVQKKLQQEIDTVLGDDTELTQEHIHDMIYLSYVIKESMRIHPAAVGTARDLQNDEVMSGYKVPAGTLAVGGNLLICRDEKYFHRAEEFLPERWARDRPYGPIHPFAALPFSTGTRMCVGKRIAEQEINAFLIRVMQKYSLTFESSQPMDILTIPFVKPVIPLKFKFHHREKG